MRRLSAFFLAGLVFMTASLPVAAGEVGIQVGFSDREISTIQAWYRDHDSAVQGGNIKAGKGGKGLPPGIAKNLQRGKPLPPGIAKQALPSGLVTQLPPPPKGFERIEIAGKVLLVEIATQVIHDVLEDVILRR
jgi:Ni/Co efflux regulator RcnB